MTHGREEAEARGERKPRPSDLPPSRPSQGSNRHRPLRVVFFLRYDATLKERFQPLQPLIRLLHSRLHALSSAPSRNIPSHITLPIPGDVV